MGGRLLESQLFGVDSSDPLTLLVVLLTLGAAALLACYMPARRATRVAPLTALRSE
jgi:putative ABC transport system permease protein